MVPAGTLLITKKFMTLGTTEEKLFTTTSTNGIGIGICSLFLTVHYIDLIERTCAETKRRKEKFSLEKK